MRKLAIGLFGMVAACSPSATSAQAARPLRADAPRLIIAISVDQLSGDIWDAYRPHFSGGLARLAGGTVFRNGFQSHAASETCPGHSTLLTSWHPAKNGIVANTWVDQSIARTDKTVYCAEDETVAGSTSTNYTASPAHLRARTLGELLKSASPASRNVAVAGKDRAAIMMSGHRADQRWYWDGKSTFVSDNKAAAVPASVAAFRTALATSLAQPREALVPPAFCAGKDKSYVLSPSLTVGNNRFARGADDFRNFRISPDFDGAVLALSAALIGEMKLGKGGATDILSVGLSATDYVGHAYGSGGMEMCLQIAALDQQLGRFLETLDRQGLDYAVVLTADHGVLDIPERLRDRGVADAARMDAALTVGEMARKVAGSLGLASSKPVLLGGASEVWADAGLPAADRRRVLDQALKTYRAHPQVYGAYTRAQIAALAMPNGDPRSWSVQQRLRASFDPQRSGELMIVLKPNITPIPAPSFGYAATHGSPWDYDRRVPIVFWRKGMTPANREEWADTVDLMPTLAAMIGLQLAPGTTDGRCLAVEGASCPR
jgi:predicted AlkP superfamily pyrophosphatase or phosphodiesterase